MNNTILITGSNGFIGNYFINKYNIKTFSFLNDNINTLERKHIVYLGKANEK